MDASYIKYENLLLTLPTIFRETYEVHELRWPITARTITKRNTVDKENLTNQKVLLSYKKGFQNKLNTDMYSEHDTKIKEALKKYFFNQYNQQ